MSKISTSKLFYMYYHPMSKTPENHLQLNKEIKQCEITQPYEALQSNFAKKLVDHLLPQSKFKEEHIKGIAQKGWLS